VIVRIDRRSRLRDVQGRPNSLVEAAPRAGYHGGMNEGPFHDADAIADAVAIARNVLDGKLDLLNGCAELSYKVHLGGLAADPEFGIFMGVWSESNHLPLGPDRRHWNAEALKRKDENIAQITAAYRETVLAACRRLIERFGQPSISEKLISD
jgi:hypothetical protein